MGTISRIRTEGASGMIGDMLKRKTLAIMFTDMKDFTQYITQASRPESMELIRKHENLLLPVMEAYGGILVKTIGDSFLVTFESPTNAVLAGMDLQRTLREHNATIADPQKKIEIRVAINAGEVTLADNDVYGEAVNIASRVLGIADANEVYFTEAVYLAMNKKEVPSSEIGYRFLKGVPEKVKIYKVLTETSVADPPTNEPIHTPTAGPEGKAEAPVPPSPQGRTTTPSGVSPRVLMIPGIPHPVAHSGRRFLAFLLDFLILAVIAEALKAGEGAIIINALYYVLFWTFKSATPGKMILGLRIVKEDGKPLTIGTSLVRYVGYWVSFLSLLVGILWVLWDQRKQGWHDKIAGTFVVKVR